MDREELVTKLRGALADIHRSKRSQIMGGPMLFANSDDTLEEDAQRRISEVADALAAQALTNELTEADLSAMVDRFLAWPLPDSVSSDVCVSVREYGKEEGWPPRCGTNLLTADEARQMLTHVIRCVAKMQQAKGRQADR